MRGEWVSGQRPLRPARPAGGFSGETNQAELRSFSLQPGSFSGEMGNVETVRPGLTNNKKPS
jgi:hypothetical protein